MEIFTYNLSLIFFHTFNYLLMLFLTLESHFLLSAQHAHKLIDKSLLLTIQPSHDFTYSGTIHQHREVVLGLPWHQGKEGFLSFHRGKAGRLIEIR
jgi:hypothetical protein